MLVLALGIPIPLVLFFRWRGVVYGAIFHWIVLIAAGQWLIALDPNRSSGILDSIWLLGGWIQGLLYCCFLLLVIRYITQKTKSQNEMPT